MVPCFILVVLLRNLSLIKLGHEDEEKEKKDLTPFQKPIWTVHRQYRTPPVTPNGCFL
jgi:hypothetical protein